MTSDLRAQVAACFSAVEHRKDCKLTVRLSLDRPYLITDVTPCSCDREARLVDGVTAGLSEALRVGKLDIPYPERFIDAAFREASK